MEQDLFGGESSAEEDSSSEDEQLQLSPHEEDEGETRQHGTRGAAPASSSGSSSPESESGDRGEQEAGSSEAIPESQFPSTQDLFGASSSSSESSSSDREDDHHPASSSPPKGASEQVESSEVAQSMQGLFGDTAELSSSSDEEETRERSAPPLDDQQETVREEEEEVPRIDVEIPRCVAQLGSEPNFIKLPNFLSIETRPFDEAVYEDEAEDDGEILDEDGRARLKLKVENTVRWRYSQDEDGKDVKESNSRIVRWSDGTMSLYLGGEIFDIYKQPLQGEYSHLFVRQGTGLQGQAVFRSKLTFRPHSTDSQTHRKMTLSIADRFSKAQKIRVLPVVGKDPESQRSEKIKKEEQKLKASVRLENQRKRSREKENKQSITAGFLEAGHYDDYEDDEEEETSLKAIKSSVRSRMRDRRDQESESDEEEVREERLMKVKEGDRKRASAPSDAATPFKKKGRKLLLSDDEDEEEEEEDDEESYY